MQTRHAFAGTIAWMGGRGRESERGARFFGHDHLEAAIAALGAEQHAVVGLDQLRALGLSARAIQQRAASGRLHRIHRGVYSLVPAKLLTRDGRSDRARAGINVHRSTTLAPKHVTRLRGIPCTTVARTLLDLAEVLDRRALERAFDQAEIVGAFDLRALKDQLKRNPTRHGVPEIRAILADHHIGRTPTWSELEERFLRLVRAAHIREPEVNAWVVPPDREPAMRVDFVWRAERVGVETDGRRTHRTRQALERDRRRDQRLIAGGWRPIRTTWRQITRAPDQLMATLIGLLNA